MANMTYRIMTTANSVRIDFDADYFRAACADATIDFDELEIAPSFTIDFVDDKPVIHDEPLFDESHIVQLFNADVLADLIAADARFDNDENPY
jgi:hypothetical protein